MDIALLDWKSTPIVETGAYWVRMRVEEVDVFTLARVIKQVPNGSLWLAYVATLDWVRINPYAPMPPGMYWCGPLLAPPNNLDMQALRLGRDIQAKEGVANLLGKFSKS